MSERNNIATTVLISGGAAGIGRAIAEAFLGSGANVHVCDVSQDHIKAFLAANPRASATRADISDVSQVGDVFRDLQNRYDELGVLVNNAGIAGPTAAIDAIEVEEWDRCIAVDLNGLFYVTKQAVPLLKKNGGGSIVNIASNAALFGFPLRSPYTAAKWAQIGLTKTWAMELGLEGIRVNAICPGSVAGPRIDSVIARDAEQRALPPERIRDVYLRQSSMRTFVGAQEIANMVVFLSSDLAAHISGQAIAIDGHTEGLSNWLD